ncbi:hypothetical protein L6452_25872 [Arctium lappa]|uniref:Uncharacterized protein n=1 Tax=Arctium lappa TaxID=4217 RepID=A0ACB9AD02_ARCLA|nr:hypothetical protein L6452_25872 [Arctium lappa]
MTTLKSANKKLKGMMKTVKIQDFDSIFIAHNAELDALEADMGLEIEGEGVPSYLKPDNEPKELNFPSAPSGHASRVNNQVVDELGLPVVPNASIHS